MSINRGGERETDRRKRERGEIEERERRERRKRERGERKGERERGRERNMKALGSGIIWTGELLTPCVWLWLPRQF